MTNNHSPPPQAQAETCRPCRPPPPQEDWLLFCLFLFIHTHVSLFSPLFLLSSLFLISAKLKGASFLNLLLHPCPKASIKDSTKGSATGDIEGGQREEQVDVVGVGERVEDVAQLHNLVLPPVPTIHSTGFLLCFSSFLITVLHRGVTAETSTSSNRGIPGCTAQGPSVQQQESRSVTVRPDQAPKSSLCL